MSKEDIEGYLSYAAPVIYEIGSQAGSLVASAVGDAIAQASASVFVPPANPTFESIFDSSLQDWLRQNANAINNTGNAAGFGVGAVAAAVAAAALYFLPPALRIMANVTGIKLFEKTATEIEQALVDPTGYHIPGPTGLGYFIVAAIAALKGAKKGYVLGKNWAEVKLTEQYKNLRNGYALCTTNRDNPKCKIMWERIMEARIDALKF
jgi:hypothetical protein